MKEEMMNFKGQRGPSQRKYDYLTAEREDSAVMVMIYEGEYRNRAGLHCDAKTARKIAAALIKLADEAEGVT
jgi:hypothetical protein